MSRPVVSLLRARFALQEADLRAAQRAMRANEVKLNMMLRADSPDKEPGRLFLNNEVELLWRYAQWDFASYGRGRS